MLELVDLSKRVGKDVYKEVFPDLEIRLGEVQRAALGAGVPVIVVFEGWDAAGKGTLINRLTQALDPRGFKVHPVNAPDANERLHPWMWRFWGKLPPGGACSSRAWSGWWTKRGGPRPTSTSRSSSASSPTTVPSS